MLISQQKNNFITNDSNQSNQIEKKPVHNSDNSTYRSVNQNLSILKKQFNKNMDGLVRIVSENIVYTFFNIDSENMTNLITKFINWPISDIVKSFIINYYIPHKNDLILKTFVLYNIDKLVGTVVDIIEITLIKNSGLINFNHDAFEDQIKQLRTQLEDKTKLLNQQLGQLRDDINKQFEGKEGDVFIDDKMNVEVADVNDLTKMQNILRTNVQKSVLQQYNELLSTQGLGSVVIDTTKDDTVNLSIDKITDQQQKEQVLRQKVRDDILNQLGFTDITFEG